MNSEGKVGSGRLDEDSSIKSIIAQFSLPLPKEETNQLEGYFVSKEIHPVRLFTGKKMKVSLCSCLSRDCFNLKRRMRKQRK